jgi:glycosyltransferase involved in cell wall biosynthesis
VIFVEESVAWGGTEQYLHLLATGLVDHGVDVTIATPVREEAILEPFRRRFETAADSIVSIPGDQGATGSVPARSLAAMRFFRGRRRLGTVIHFNQHVPASLGAEIIGGRLARASPLVATNHLPVLGEPSYNFLGRRLWQLARASLDLVITESSANGSLLTRNGLAPPERVRVVLHGIDTERFKPPSADARAEARRRFGINDRTLAIVSVARLWKQKRHDVLMQALARLRVHTAHSEVVLLIAGDGPELGTLERLRSELGLVDVVRFLDHIEPCDELYAAGDVFGLASDFEGLPMSILEAMSCGLPVVATDVGGNRDAVVDGVTGCLLPPGQPDALAQSFRLLWDAGTRTKMGAAARQRAEQLFQDSRMIDQTVVAYEDALAGTL